MIIGIISIILIILLIITFICFKITFLRNKKYDDIYYLPNLKEYNESKEDFKILIDKFNEVEYKSIYIKSYDDLKLHARYYEGDKDVVALCFHGYRATAVRDFCGGSELLLKKGYKTIIVDQRSHGLSEGKVITFGIKERRDVLSWINYVNREFKDHKIILFGISMGASTVLMSSDLTLPKNVVGIVADSPYSTIEDIIKEVLKTMELSTKIFYPFISLSSILFGGFDINSSSAIKSVKNTNIPIYLIHGKNDTFVPQKLSVKIEKNIKGKKEVFYCDKAQHGLSYIVSEKEYISHFNKFLKEIL